MKLKKDLQKILKNESGVALMMIMTSIIILMAIYSEFTFESKISRIKATNILDRSQARLLAESGLQLAVTRLRLYKEAYNKVQGNQSASKAVSPQLLNQLWEVPFMYPIPVGKDAPAAFKSTVEKFETENLLDGQMKVNIQNISNRLNVNLLRIDATKIDPNNEESRKNMTSMLDTSPTAIQTDPSVDQTLFFLLKKLVDAKKDTDEAFEDRYGSLNYQELISNLKYYVSDFGSMVNDPMVGEAEASFQKIPLTPKYGPLGSASELYSIPGWNDELIELIQNEFSAYPTTQIDLNKITANMLQILVPTIQELEIKEFFMYRDDPLNPKFFSGKEDFKRYIVETARLMNATDFDSRMTMLEKNGVTFGSNPNLFKVIAEGTFNRSVYTLIAYVVLPQQEAAANLNNNNSNNNNSTASGSETNNNSTSNTAKPNAQLLEPRIIEIQVN